MKYTYATRRESFRTAHFRNDGHGAVRCTSRTDVSLEHSSYLDYDSDCGYCYLNGAHTRDYHRAAIDAARSDHSPQGNCDCYPHKIAPEERI